MVAYEPMVSVLRGFHLRVAPTTSVQRADLFIAIEIMLTHRPLVLSSRRSEHWRCFFTSIIFKVVVITII